MVVKAFQQPIGLCVDCCGSDVENVQKGPEGGSELNVTVRCDGVRNTKIYRSMQNKMFLHRLWQHFGEWHCFCPVYGSVHSSKNGPHEYGKNSILRWILKLVEGRCECKFWLFGRLCIGMPKV
jgi:hypothetical protein